MLEIGTSVTASAWNNVSAGVTARARDDALVTASAWDNASAAGSCFLDIDA